MQTKTNVEFKPWPKIPRTTGKPVTITEKINGTNSCVAIVGGKLAAVQSRKRFITPEDDNFGFAQWVQENEEDLLSLGEGWHYGEWAGPGIQKNPHNLEQKTWFLFNTARWNPASPNLPKCCSVVPVLYEGPLEAGTVSMLLEELVASSEEGVTPEGVITYHSSTRSYTKNTIVAPEGKWKEK